MSCLFTEPITVETLSRYMLNARAITQPFKSSKHTAATTRFKNTALSALCIWLNYSKTATKISISVLRERDTTRIHLSSALKVLRVRTKQLDAFRVRTVTLRLSRASNRKYRLNWKTCLRKIHQSVQRESYDVNNVVTALDTLNADNPPLHVQCRATSRSART